MRLIARTASASFAAIGIAVAAPLAAAATIVPPFKTYAPAATPTTSTAFVCPSHTPVVRLSTDSGYDPNDDTRSTVDPALQAAYEAEIAPVRAFNKSVASHANKFTSTQGARLESARCVLSLLDRWASANAMSDMRTAQAEYNRSTFLAGAALSYMQVARVDTGSSKHTRIRGWMVALAQKTRSYYDALDQNWRSNNNNHRYWAGLAVAAGGLQNGDRSLLDWGVGSYRRGMCSVTGAGTLPTEVERGALALHYQMFALQPLVLLNEIALRNGVSDPGGSCPGAALHRLVQFSLAAHENPALMAAEAGVPQDTSSLYGSSMTSTLSWLPAYDRRYARHNPWAAEMTDLPSLSSSSLGGSQTMLYDY